MYLNFAFQGTARIDYSERIFRILFDRRYNLKYVAKLRQQRSISIFEEKLA